MPLQLLALVEQPPWPLQAFMPLQACLAMLLISILECSLSCEAQPAAVPSSSPPTARASTLAARAGAVSWTGFLITLVYLSFVKVGMGLRSWWFFPVVGRQGTSDHRDPDSSTTAIPALLGPPLSGSFAEFLLPSHRAGSRSPQRALSSSSSLALFQEGSCPHSLSVP